MQVQTGFAELMRVQGRRRRPTWTGSKVLMLKKSAQREKEETDLAKIMITVENVFTSLYRVRFTLLAKMNLAQELLSKNKDNSPLLRSL